MTDYNAKTAELAAGVGLASSVKRARELLIRYGPWIRRYKGGMTPGLVAAVIQSESDGNPTVKGDPNLGEYGLMQVNNSLPGNVGLPAEARFDPETNVFLGALGNQIEATRMASHYPTLVLKGSEDQWRLARLANSIGPAGARRLIDAAIASGKVQRGRVFDAVRDLVDHGGSVSVSASQSADKVRYRVHFVDHHFDVARQTGVGWFGPPQVTPAPPKYPRYSYPASLLRFTGKPSSSALLIGAALAALGILIARSTT